MFADSHMKYFMANTFKDSVVNSVKNDINESISNIKGIGTGIWDFLTKDSDYSGTFDETVNEWDKISEKISANDYTIFEPADKKYWTEDQINMENREETRREFDALEKASENYLADVESDAIGIQNKINGIYEKFDLQKKFDLASKTIDLICAVKGGVLKGNLPNVGAELGKKILEKSLEIGIDYLVYLADQGGADTSGINALRDTINPSVLGNVNDFRRYIEHGKRS